LPNCQVHFAIADCPNELQAAHQFKKILICPFHELFSAFFSAQKNQIAPDFYLPLLSLSFSLL
jgi:hypothetical protein